MALADSCGCLGVAGQMHMLTPPRLDSLRPSRIEIGAGGAVEKLIRRRDSGRIKVNGHRMALCCADAPPVFRQREAALAILGDDPVQIFALQPMPCAFHSAQQIIDQYPSHRG